MVQELRCSPVEIMACVASRILEDNTMVLVGTGLPVVASVLAQRTHAPHLFTIFEAGGMGAKIPVLPISVGDSRTIHHAIMASSMDYVMSTAQLGYIDYGFLGGAQIDAYGNLNTTVIGSYRKPKARLPGSGGGNDCGSLCWRTIIIMHQDRRRFVKKVDFVTTPGYLTGPGARERAGLPLNTGPYRVITQLGVMEFDKKTKRMTLLSVHPGVTVDEVKANTSFRLLIPTKVAVTESPTERELTILREEIDPTGIVLGRG
jgi:glutaconate CoA-transferase subunit B